MNSLNSNILTIGNFDGVHIGHRQLLGSTSALARSWCGRAIALTFHPHPHQFFTPTDHYFIYPQKIKESILSSLGLDEAVYLPFDKIHSLTPEDFFTAVLLPLDPAAIVLGENFHFGANKSGDIRLLRDMCALHGIALHTLTMQKYKGESVSSTRIRRAISEGNLSDAANMLGTAYTLTDTVIRGAGRGHTIGFATANIEALSQVLPAPGAYASKVRIDGVGPWREAVTAITRTPTFGEVKTRVETHIMDFCDPLYDHKISVQFHAFMRPEQVFSSAEALQSQLRLDCLAAHDLLTHL